MGNILMLFGLSMLIIVQCQIDFVDPSKNHLIWLGIATIIGITGAVISLAI